MLGSQSFKGHQPSDRTGGGFATITGQPQPSARPKAATLDLLRAVAALSVVVLHVTPLAKRLGVTIPWADVGGLGVQLFFVLSGYLITSAVLSRSYTPRSYVVHRSLRILPAYFFCLVLVLFISNAQPMASWGGLKDVATHSVLLHGWFKDYRTSLNPVLWTLSIEWLFYAFMLVCARGIRHRTVSWCIVGAMFVGPILYRMWTWKNYAGQPAEMNFLYKQLPGMMDQFAWGMIAALALQHAPARRFVARRGVKGAGLLLSLAVLGLATLQLHQHSAVAYWFNQYMVVLWPLVFCGAATVLMVSMLQFETQLAPWVRRSGLGFVGVCSYSLYLFHPLVLGAFARGWKPRVATVSPSLYLLMAVVAVLVTAAVSYYLVERPFMQLRGRFSGRPPALTPHQTNRRSAPTESPAFAAAQDDLVVVGLTRAPPLRP